MPVIDLFLNDDQSESSILIHRRRIELTGQSENSLLLNFYLEGSSKPKFDI